MKKQNGINLNGINLNGWNNLNQSILKTNGMMQDLIKPIAVPEWSIGNSALLESCKIQDPFEEMIKRMHLSDTFNPLGLSALIQPLSAFQDIDINSQVTEMFKQISIASNTGVQEMLESMQRSLKTSTIGLETAFSKLNTSLNTSWMDAWNRSTEILKTSGIIDYINNYENYEDYYNDEAAIRPEEIEEFQVTLNDLSYIDEKNWQQKIVFAYNKWKEKNPIFARFLIVLIQIFLFSVSCYVQTVIAPIAFATIRNGPNTQAETMAVFDKNQKMIIIDEGVPYYYEIEFPEPATGDIKIGWVSKKSVMVIEEDTIEEETVTEEQK